MKKMIVALVLPFCVLPASYSDGQTGQKQQAEQKMEVAATEKPVSTQAADPGVVINWQRPTDIPGGAANASLTQAAQFAWNQFIALNWPAMAQNGNSRDKPDPAQPFGATGGPLVWHTYGRSEQAP